MKNVFDRMVTEDKDAFEPAGDGVAQPPMNGAALADSEEGAIRTSAEVKEVIQELLKHGNIEEAPGSNLFRRAITHEGAVSAALEPLDLVLRLDSHRGVAFLAVAQPAKEHTGGDEGWAHPLVRRQRLTLEQSLLIALLRQAFVVHEQESGVGQNAATIAVDELLPHFMAYAGDSGSDAKNENRLLSLLDQLKTHGIVSEVDKKQEVVIRPLIAHLANPDSLAALLVLLKNQRHTLDAVERED
ncbi:MAG TPA: DUF4194 domain-containing protein [Pirellulales bacterium]